MMRHIKHYAEAERSVRSYFRRLEKSAGKDARAREKVAKDRERWLGRLDAADALRAEVVEIDISVDWTNSRTWGRCPRAKVWLVYEFKAPDGETDRGISRARSRRVGGYGYCKVSVAVDEALSSLDARAVAALDRMVVEAGPEAWKEYAFDKTPFPHFSFGGKGLSTFTGLFRTVCLRFQYHGGKPFPKYVIDRHEGKCFDTYHVMRRDKI